MVPESTAVLDEQGCVVDYVCECVPVEENPFTDDDGDGYTSDVDCNDGDKTIHPGAVELCNGVDDDCDAEVDEGSCVTDPTQCDDDIDALCDMEPPTCDAGLLLAVQQGCYVCVDPETCAPPVAPEIALCNATGGTWDECGCPAVTCENPPPGPDEEALPCPPACWEVCECPADTPIWDEAAGCVALSACEDAPIPDAALCASTGGTFNECGSDCDLFTCETPPSEGPYPCSAAAVCVEICECPEDAPVWDAEQGCIAEAACEGGTEDPVEALCEATGGVMDDCLSACPPDPCADGPQEPMDCPAVCVYGCACPEDAPHWDATDGCVAEPNCPGSSGESGEGDEPDEGDEPGEPGEGDSPEPGEGSESTEDGETPASEVPESDEDSGGCQGGSGQGSLLWIVGACLLALTLRRRTSVASE